ncbi:MULTISPECIES: hypothetical protein [Oxalobacteraceae]|uniref:hypothetical protein n=1 Tax=Oxalobacteraceae TaxID=75682 RepID=UPI00114D00EE|nr:MULTISPECIES: hypothetical protein [Oxalobacteraceae]
MVRLLKLLLLYLMIAALPVQALASVVQKTCPPGHARQAAGETRHGKTSQHRVKVRVAKKHAGIGNAVAAEKAAQQGDSACGTCVDCCLGGAIVPPVLVSGTPHDRTEVHLSANLSLVSGFIPDGIERPPRNIFG